MKVCVTSHDIDFPLDVLPGGGMNVGVALGLDLILWITGKVKSWYILQQSLF